MHADLEQLHILAGVNVGLSDRCIISSPADFTGSLPSCTTSLDLPRRVIEPTYSSCMREVWLTSHDAKGVPIFCDPSCSAIGEDWNVLTHLQYLGLTMSGFNASSAKQERKEQPDVLSFLLRNSVVLINLNEGF